MPRPAAPDGAIGRGGRVAFPPVDPERNVVDQPVLPDYAGACISNIVPALLDGTVEPPAWLPDLALDASDFGLENFDVSCCIALHVRFRQQSEADTDVDAFHRRFDAVENTRAAHVDLVLGQCIGDDPPNARERLEVQEAQFVGELPQSFSAGAFGQGQDHRIATHRIEAQEWIFAARARHDRCIEPPGKNTGA